MMTRNSTNKLNLAGLTTAGLAAVAFWLCSCGATGTLPHSMPAAPDVEAVATADITALQVEQQAILPPFPGADSPVSVMHVTSESDIVVGGSEFTEEQGEGNEPGPSGPEAYIIAPGGEDDLAWATYGIGGFDPDRPVSIEIELHSAPLVPGGDDPLPLGAWIGLSNYSTYSWEWFGPYEDSVSLEINSSQLHDRYVSSSNSFYYTVVTDSTSVEQGPGNPDGTTAVEIIASTTTAVDAESDDYNNTTPHYPVDSESGIGDGKQGSALDPALQFVTVFWNHITDDASAQNEATHYDIYRRRLGSSEGLALLGTLAAPAEQFIDPTDTRPLIGAVTPGEKYEYSVVARNGAGPTPVSHSGMHQIPLLGPAAALATYGLSTGWIRCNWERSEGAVEYLLYRDSQDEPLATLGDVDNWRDQTVPDLLEHTYWIRGVNKYGTPGEFSQPATGKLNAAPVAAIGIGPGMARGILPHRVLFDGSASSDPDHEGAGNGIVLYEWDADGDGDYEFSSTAADYEYFYLSDTGSFNARLRVTDNRGAIDVATLEIQVNIPPVAQITVDPVLLAGTLPHSVLFSGADSSDPDHEGAGNGIVLYEWDADGNGDFEFSSGSPEYDFVYNGNHGDFTAVLRVTDADGETSQDTVGIHVNHPPLADLSAAQTVIPLFQPLFLSALASTDPDGTIVNFVWDLNGNGIFNEEENGENGFAGQAEFLVAFTETGVFDVGVRVTDDFGATDIDTVQITVITTP